jgi:hypothetical protein
MILHDRLPKTLAMTLEKLSDFDELGLKPEYIGTSVDDWLMEEGFADEVHAEAMRELTADRLLHQVSS